MQEVADSCKTGAATNIIFGLALGYQSAIVPCIVIAICIFLGFSFASLFGVACAALGMLTTLATGGAHITYVCAVTLASARQYAERWSFGLFRSVPHGLFRSVPHAASRPVQAQSIQSISPRVPEETDSTLPDGSQHVLRNRLCCLEVCSQ